MKQLCKKLSKAFDEGYNNEPNKYFGAMCDGQGLGQLDRIAYGAYVRGQQKRRKEQFKRLTHK